MPTTVTPAGVQASSAVGTAGVGTGVLVTGVQATSAVGSVTPSTGVAPLGVQAQSAVGRVGISASGATVTPAGVGALAGVGAPLVVVPLNLFLVPPDWSEPVIHTPAWRTDVLVGEDGTEQRVSQRDGPAERIRYEAALMDQVEAGTELLILGTAQDARVLMPRWFDATALTGAVSIGATSIPCDTTDRGFVVGGQVLLWRRTAQLSEVRTIAGVSSSAIDITGDPATMNWAFPSDTVVLPVAPARLVLPLARTYVGGILSSVRIEADWEGEAPPTLGPTASAAVTITIVVDEGASNIFRPGAYVVAHAEVLDADGLEIPEAVVTWSVDDPTICTVQPVGIFGHQAIVRRIDSSLVTSTNLHATSGGVTATIVVGP